MTDMIGLAASAAGGGIFGLVGTALGRAGAYLERRQQYAQERARWEHELRVAERRHAAEAEARAADLAKVETSGRWSGLSESISADASIAPSYRWVDAIRGLTRPLLTLMLWAIAFAIFVTAPDAGRAAITETATFAATAATLWWFGDRGPAARSSGR